MSVTVQPLFSVTRRVSAVERKGHKVVRFTACELKGSDSKDTGKVICDVNIQFFHPKVGDSVHIAFLLDNNNNKEFPKSDYIMHGTVLKVVNNSVLLITFGGSLSMEIDTISTPLIAQFSKLYACFSLIKQNTL